MLQLYTNYDRVTIPVTNYILCPYMNNKLPVIHIIWDNLLYKTLMVSPYTLPSIPYI